MSSNLNMIEKWTTVDGNLCFRFQERKVFERPWMIVLFAFLFITGTLTEYFVKGSLHSFSPNIIAFFFVFLWWLTIPMKANEAIIENTIHELMDDIVASDAEVAGAEVVKSRVHYDTKGTYATIFGRCFLVLIKSGQVWEYPIIYHNPSKEEDGYYECMREYVVSENIEHIRSIKPSRWRRFVEGLEVSDNVKLWLLILAIVVVGGLAFAGGYWVVLRLRWWVLLPVGIYGIVYGIIDYLARLRPSKTMSVVVRAVSLPIVLVYVFIGLMQPFCAIMGTYFFVAMFTFGVPTIILTGLLKVGWVELRPEAIAFVVLALGSVLCSNHTLTKWVISHSPLKNWGNHEYEHHREQLSFYLVHPSNMVFLIYLMYFFFLTISGFRLIQCGSYLISESYDASILKAFLVYIAYTNMRVKASQTDIDAKVLLQRISGLFVHDE